MPWTDPETGYTIEIDPTPESLNALGRDLIYLKNEDATLSGNKTFSDNVSIFGDADLSGGVSFNGTVDTSIPADHSSKIASLLIFTESVSSLGYSSEFTIERPCILYATSDYSQGSYLNILTLIGEFEMANFSGTTSAPRVVMPGIYRLKNRVAASSTLSIYEISNFGGDTIT